MGCASKRKVTKREGAKRARESKRVKQEERLKTELKDEQYDSHNEALLNEMVNVNTLESGSFPVDNEFRLGVDDLAPDVAPQHTNFEHDDGQENGLTNNHELHEPSEPQAEAPDAIERPEQMDPDETRDPVPLLGRNAPITVELARSALGALEQAVKSLHKAPKIDKTLQRQSLAMAAGLRLYCHPGYNWDFTHSTDIAAIATGHGKSYGRTIRRYIRAYMETGDLPQNQYGKSSNSIFNNEGLCDELKAHLRSKGKYMKAEDAVEYLSTPEVKLQYQLEEPPSKRTIQRFMEKKLGYKWGKELKGQYVDGHEREDVVKYRNDEYIPQWTSLEHRMETFDPITKEIVPPSLNPGEKPVKVLMHDETIYYGNNQRLVRWVGKDETPVPMPKGEGHSFMYGGFISLDGWLRSDNPNKNPELIIRPGGSRDGYMTNEKVCAQFQLAAKLAQEQWPDHEIVFVYDNATTHTKRRVDAPSAVRMPLGPSQKFAVLIPDPANPKKKLKIRMGDARFADGTPQSLYFPDDHPEHPKEFKGIRIILQERGIEIGNLKHQCPKFKCAPGARDCCAKRMLFTQPDFANQKSKMEELADLYGSRILFLPKFHCELNPIEQCWGYAKRIYREMPRAKREAEIQSNMMASLDSVPLESIRRFWNRSLRFMDAYRRGLNGQQAAWAAKKYRSHRVLPAGILAEIEEELRRAHEESVSRALANQP